MGMVFCRGCGKEIHETAPTCPHCGAPQGMQCDASVAISATEAIPAGVRGWSWGAFLLNWIWAIGNRTWIGLLALVPYLGLIMAIVLGFKGREWAWKNKQWDNIDHFNRVQKKWSYWGVVIMIVAMVVGVLAAIAIPAYQDYQRRAREAAEALAMQQAEAERAANEERDLEARRQEQARLQQSMAQAAAAGWSQQFSDQVFTNCAQAAQQRGDQQGVDKCRCIVGKASTIIPEQRMNTADSDPEVQAAINQIASTCQ